MSRSGFVTAALLIAGIALFHLSGCASEELLGIIPITDEVSSSNADVELVLDAGSTDRVDPITVALENTGSRTVLVSRIAYSVPEAFSIYSEQLPGAIEPGSSAELEISFHPPASEAYRTVIQVYVDGREFPVTFYVYGGTPAPPE